MKKAILILFTISILYSCSKNCDGDNCGKIISDNASDFSVVIRNSCSGHEKRFYLSPGDWMTAYVGDDYCITNSNGW